jgi:acyl-CoA synthetase (AMP-forming)/AMP-acid ligase II
VIELYGMTETCGAMTSNPLKGEKRLGSVGLPMPNMRVKIVDIETGKIEMPLGEDGEIICCSKQNKIAYFNKPKETEHTLREFQGEKWLYSGDIGHMDEDGYIYVVDRLKDMIIVSGYKVFSNECEEKLYEHPAIEYCAFIGIPNPDRPGSEIVKAFIQLTENHKEGDLEALKKDITTFAKSHMAPYKVPKVIEFIDNMPLTSVGKLDKKALR